MSHQTTGKNPQNLRSENTPVSELRQQQSRGNREALWLTPAAEQM
jgi:hypothetical protein